MDETAKPKRRRFGTILIMRRKDGLIQTWMARYTYHGIHCQKSFGPDGQWLARQWLEEEELLVNLDRRGVQTWQPPKERKRQLKARELTFGAYANSYVSRHRRRDGTALAGSSRRNLRADISHLRDAFGEQPLSEITPGMVNDWYIGEHPEGPWAFKRECERLRAIMTEASSPDINGLPPIIETNPFTLPIPPDPEPESWNVRPVDAGELRALYEAMPSYTRISIYLAAMAGGMRIGELCGLQQTDFDLEQKVLSINNSVNRGADDLGRSQLGKTKSPHSRRTCPIPELLIPLIRDHMATLDTNDPMFLQAKRGDVIAQTTLAGQLKNARERIGLADPVTFRTLRVTHTTLMLQNGGTVREAMDEIGDSTMQVVMTHYARTIPEHQRLVVNRMAGQLAASDTGLAATLRGAAALQTPSDTNDDTRDDPIIACLREVTRILVSTLDAVGQGNANQD
jgi:integrase